MSIENKRQWLHPVDCPCNDCRRDRPDVPDQLSWRHFIVLTLLGILAGHAIAFLYDPAGSLAIARDLWSFGR